MTGARILPVTVFLCLFSASLAASSDKAKQAAVGLGGYPLTPLHASLWLIERADADGRHLPFLVYLEGAPGWHDRPTTFQSDFLSRPATFEMKVGETPVRVAFWPETSEVEVSGSRFDLSVANVFLVSDIDNSPSVRPLGLHTLFFTSDENPATALVRRSSAIRAALARREHVPEELPTSALRNVSTLDQAGIALLSAGNAERACEHFRRAASEGYAPAQYRLGYCYETGEGVPKDERVANEWYEKAARQGHLNAQYKLGHSYRVGRGVEVDLKAALAWYKLAAENGDAEAMHNVGWMHATGQGVEADANEAFRWFLRSANKGETASQFEIARRYYAADGIAKDPKSSYAWLLVLNAQRRNFDSDSLKQIQGMMEEVALELNESQKAEATSLSAELLESVSRQYIATLVDW